MVFGIAALVAFVSQTMTLEPGDLIATGTPAGVGPLTAGDVVEVEIPEVGVLRNPVSAESREGRSRARGSRRTAVPTTHRCGSAPVQW